MGVPVWGYAVGLAILVSFRAVGGDLSCGQELALEGAAQRIRLAMEQDEEFATAVVPLPGRRVAVGTRILEPGRGTEQGRRIVGGRLLVHDIATDEPLVALETPTADGNPSSMSELASSPDGRFLAATGGYLFGGPVLTYETDPVVRRIRSVQVEVNRGEEAVEVWLALFEKASSGDEGALERLAVIDRTGEILETYRRAPEQMRDYLRMALVPPDEKPTRIPAMGVDFHPNGRSYLINAGIVSIRDSSTGRELRRHPLTVPARLGVLDPPHYKYLGGGDYIAGISRGYLLLWDATTGEFLDAKRHEGELGFEPVLIHTAADRTTLSVWMKTARGAVRQVWSAERNGERASLVKVAEAVAPSDSERYPAVALADDFRYALSDGGGAVGVYRGGQLVETIRGSDSRTVTSLALSRSGDWLAIVGQDAAGAFLELWSLPGARGIRLRAEPSAEGMNRRLHLPTFSSDGSWLSLSAYDYGPGMLDPSTTSYIVDVYKLMAEARAARP
jgi:WD40 repeat protein